MQSPLVSPSQLVSRASQDARSLAACLAAGASASSLPSAVQPACVLYEAALQGRKRAWLQQQQLWPSPVLGARARAITQAGFRCAGWASSSGASAKEERRALPVRGFLILLGLLLRLRAECGLFSLPHLPSGLPPPSYNLSCKAKRPLQLPAEQKLPKSRRSPSVVVRQTSLASSPRGLKMTTGVRLSESILP